MATVTLKGNECNLAGNELNVGDKAPEVKVVKSDDLSEITVGGAKDKAQLIIAVPSLDTPVCAMETTKFNNQAADIDGLEVTVVSMDLPFAAKRFCSTEGIENLTVASDFRNKDFANAYRAIFIVDKDGTIAYKQLVPEITEEPNYEEALNAAKEVASK